MIETIQGAPPGLLAFKAVGDARFEDYSVPITATTPLEGL